MNDECYRECPDRNITCHFDCPRYKKQREKADKAKQERQKEIALIIYEIDQKNRAIEASRGKKRIRKRRKK